MNVSKRKNQGVAPASAKRSTVYLQSLISRLIEAVNATELKFRFRDSINHFGFEGFICDRSLFQPLSDNEILVERDHPSVGGASEFIKFFDETNLYNDIAQRLGAKSASYLSAITAAADRYFGDRHGQQVRRFVQRHRTPFLNVTDAPPAHSSLL